MCLSAEDKRLSKTALPSENFPCLAYTLTSVEARTSSISLKPEVVVGHLDLAEVGTS